MNLNEPVDDLYYGGRSAEYDANVKKLLSRKIFLAWIMKYCVEEFRDMDISDIRDHAIEGKPEVGNAPVMPDFTNGPQVYGKNPERIHGDNTEDRLLTEGTVTFDIRFRAKVPDGESLGLIINVEAQKSSKLPYPLMKRALYYGSRLISSQNGVEFQGADYGKVKKVYSIWLCMESPRGKSGITRYLIKEKPESGEILQKKEYYDLMQVVMVYIGRDRERIRNRLLRMLYDVFKTEIPASEKKQIMKGRYDILLEPKDERLVETMCNLSEGIFERAMERGMKQGMEMERKRKNLEVARNFLLAGVPEDTVASCAGLSKDEVKKLKEEIGR